ncbi:MAG TPA: nucleoside triphosphate pyrophosphohydrolase [Candidatus Dojkabacteria bacterium]|nr:nucleoside triphosphate pyrophosphohydrolase [Candidatus Dojkabacteria bacterium]
MRYFKFEKLVRDNIVPQMIDNNQEVRGIKRLNDNEFITELIKKVLEEVEEMKNVKSKDELKYELADVYEVLDYIKNTLNISDSEIAKLKEQKREKNGGFDERMYIEDVGVEEDCKWLQYYLDNPDKYSEVK